MYMIRPLPAIIQETPSGRDHAKKGYSLSALEAMISDCEGQPDWRPRRDVAHAYYDMGKQLTEERKRYIRVVMGIEPRQTNLIHGVVNGVLGMEARQRSDVRVAADDEDFADVSDVMSLRMEEATRESNADMAVSNGYAGQIKGGIGWVEVSRASDPLDYPYRVTDVHAREIWWDWRAQKLDLSDARWLVRKRWQDLDEGIAMFPEHEDVLRNAINGWDMVNLPDDEDNVVLRNAYRTERATRIRRDEWCDSNRQRVKFFEVWYRVPARVVVLHMSPTRRVPYNERNPVHVEAVARGAVKMSNVVTRQMRMALFAGPHRLMDTGTTRRSFPYVPFFGFRDDEDRSPYGIIEGMMTPQDSYNERRQMVDWMLKARQVYIDNDALDKEYNTIEDIEKTAMRPDMVAVLRGDRRNAGGLRIENNISLQREQMEVMQDDKQVIQDVPRIYSTQLGNAPAGVTSGIAIQSLTEAGAVAMGEMNDNYRFARKMVHEELLQLIVEDHATENMQVMMGAGSNRRVIVLNSWDPNTGAPLNRVEDAPVKVGLSDIPSSPAFRMQEQQQLSTIIQALAGNPQALAILTPMYIESSSLDNRKAVADDLRRATGVPVAGDREATAKAQQQMEQQQAEQSELQKQVITLDMQERSAKIEETKSKTELNNAKVVEIGHDMAAGIDQASDANLGALGQPEQPQEPELSDEDRLINESLDEALAT